MVDALELIYFMLHQFLDFVFGAYFFDGVSIGSFFIGCLFFAILLKYIVAIPQIKVFNSSVEKEDDLSSWRRQQYSYYDSRGNRTL